jgi:glycosyltransferase involved in cell wall biosynthesis
LSLDTILGITWCWVRVLEALAHAIPVIVSNANYCGFSEHLTENEALLIEQPKDPAELAKHINALLNDTELRNCLAKNVFNLINPVSQPWVES